MYNKSSDLLTRRIFLKTALGGAFAVYLAGCRGTRDPLSHIRGRMVGPDAATGHLLRNPAAIPPAFGSAEAAEVVIIGGGISGLSALRWLRNAGLKDVVLLELEQEAGGNSAWGANRVSSYPWAAHYVPIPDVRNQELLDFLAEAGSITGFQNGLPVYNEFHLCAAPEERLFINGYWQEGIIPATGISSADRAQIHRFLQFMEELKRAKGQDGKDLFAIPLNNSSLEPAYRELDKLSFSAYLEREGYNSTPLRWYLEYSCKDDFGLPLHETSAWAGLHYFASRKGMASNAQSADLLTWPEGNGFLMEALQKPHKAAIRTHQLAFRIEHDAKGVSVHTYDSVKKSSGIIRAKKAVMAVPHFVGRRLLPSNAFHEDDHFSQNTPWLVANLTLGNLPQVQGQGIGLCWDNVIYGAPSVGYVHAGHQLMGQASSRVITYYKPLIGEPAAQARSKARSRSWKSWLKEIVAELSTAHPEVAGSITQADIRVWGHGMAGPRPGFIWGDARAAASTPIDNRIFFAHTDYSGISLFEEAFYQGIDAARQILQTT